MLDLTINLGHILTVTGFAGVGVGVIYAVRRDVSILETKILPLEAAANRIGDKLEIILERQGRYDERIQALERDSDRPYPRKQRRQPSPR